MRSLDSAVASALLALLGAVGCRSTPPTERDGTSTAEPPVRSTSPVSAKPTAPAAEQPPPAPALPQLKPIAAKPFPEGATEEMVCEAIDSKEPDLWVRFGHMVPAYLTGAIYVLETGPENKDKLYDYIARKYVYGYHSQQASCRGELTLLYIRRMFEESEYQGKPFGRKHLSAELEKRLGIKTRESFQFEEDQKRLSDYCRADAELCEMLVKVDRANGGTGLCPFALAIAGADVTEAVHGKRCAELSPQQKVCAYINQADQFASRRCGCSIRAALGLELDGQCERALLSK